MTSIQTQVSMTSNINGSLYTTNGSVSTPTTSSNYTILGATVTTASWTQLSSGSVFDVRAILFKNDNQGANSASIIQVFQSSSLGAGQVCTLRPGEASAMGWTGSFGTSFYAKVINIVAPVANGTLEYHLQQA